MLSSAPDHQLICDPGEKEALELRNQASVFRFIAAFFQDDAARNPYTRGTLLELHQMTIAGIFPCAGSFRDASSHVRIGGASFAPAPAYLAGLDTAALLDDATVARVLPATLTAMQHIERLTAFFHRFTVIHPFNGGNGRVGRAMLTLALYDSGLLRPPEEIFGYVARRRQRYLRALRTADVGDLTPLTNFFFRGVLDMYVQRLYRYVALTRQSGAVQTAFQPECTKLFQSGASGPAVRCYLPGAD